jgi:hypothetical protein
MFVTMNPTRIKLSRMPFHFRSQVVNAAEFAGAVSGGRNAGFTTGRKSCAIYLTRRAH